MKITAIETQALRLPLDPPFHAAWDPTPRTRFDATIVRVRTDEGVVGIASGDAMTGIEDYAHLFVGRDPLALAVHGQTLETIAFHAGRCWPLEAALWDLAGRALGAPVSELLGGATRRLPAYASLGELHPPEVRAEHAHRLVAEGFRAVKVRIARDRIEPGIAVVGAIREAVGDALEIMVDLNQWWRMPGDVAPGLSVPGARHVIDRLAAHGVLWVEEPLAGADLSGMRTLREQTGVRIAGGEMAQTFEDLDRALAADALDVYQPDVVLALGIRGTRTLGELALRRNRWFTPPHVDERHRPARQPARLLRNRRRSVHRVPVRPTRMDPRAARLHAGGAGADRLRRLPGDPRGAGAGDRARRGGRRPLRGLTRRRGPRGPASARHARAAAVGAHPSALNRRGMGRVRHRQERGRARERYRFLRGRAA